MTAYSFVSAILLIAASSTASAQASFTGAGQHSELDCGGDSATIEGAGNEITVTGDCRLLSVVGASNRIQVAMAKGGVIRVQGASNRIYWTAPTGTKPKTQVVGADNRIAQSR